VTATLALLLIYSALQIGLGVWIGRRVREGRDFFVAGGGLPAGLIFATFLAANIGAGSTVGATGIGYQDGLSAWWRNGSAGLGSLVLALWIGPLMWRQARQHGDLTLGDFLERHYGRTMRGAVAVLIWVGTLSILAGQLIGISVVLQVAGGVPPALGYVAGASVAAAYFVAGGLLSSAWVNRIQLTFILFGFAVVVPVALNLAGGFEPVLATGRAGFMGGGEVMGWRYLFVLAPAFIISPGLLQRTFAARDERAVRVGIGWNGIALLLFAFAPALLGMAAASLYPDLAHRDLALPTIMKEALPPAVAALALAAVFSAEVSTVDAVLFMLATSGSRDIYAGLFNREATDRQMLRVARIAALAGAAAGIGLAFVIGSVIAALDIFYAILTVTLFVPVLAALHMKVRPRDGLASIAAGLPTLLAVHVLTDAAGYGIMTPPLAGILASAFAFVASRSIFSRA
jgi:SSS family solute:Na+ symporter